MKEPEIVVLSGENRLDQYGNFFFKDKAGKEHKIGEKRKDKDQIAALVAANPNRGVKLIWGVYAREGKEYDIIKSIELVEEGLPEPVPVTRYPPSGPPSKSREDGMREGLQSKNRSFAISYAKDLVCAGSIEIDSLCIYADKILDWLDKPVV